ncbi:MAG: two-component system sensor histidine kinase NtrB [Thermacetogeniaceae bacterium]
MNINKDPTLNQVMEAIPLGVVVFNRSWKIVVVNSSFAGILGINPQLARDCDLKEILLGKGVNHKHPLFQTLDGYEYTGPVSPLTDSYPSYISTHLLRGEAGECLGGLLVLWNAERQQELEQAVIKAEKLAIMGQLTAITLHEVRNPLTTMKMSLQLLHQELKGSKQEKSIKWILESLDRAINLINNYLRLAKPGIPNRQLCKIGELIERVASFYAAEFSSMGIHFTRSYSPSLPLLSVDGDQFKQVLANILINAADATPSGGRVSLSVEYDQETESVRISVRDTGPGVAEDVLPHIFEPFYSSKEKGTGLGLYVCREIIHNHGGKIQVVNNSDRGCTVTIILPKIDIS